MKTNEPAYFIILRRNKADSSRRFGGVCGLIRRTTMTTNAEALAMFAKKKAAIGIKELEDEKTGSTYNSKFKTSATNRTEKTKVKLKNSTNGRRPKDSRTPGKTVCYIALLLIGTSIGISSGICSYGGAMSIFGQTNNLLNHLWWISIISAIILISGIKSQMDSIRETVFTEKKAGKVVLLRIRRRHEVIITVAKRVATGLLIAIIIGIALHYGIAHYKPLITGATPASVISDISKKTSAVPSLGSDVFFVLFTMLATLIMLIAAELSLRITQKEGMPHQASAIFLSATIFSSLTMYSVTTLL